MRQDAPTVARGEGKCTDIPALVTDDRAAGGRNPFQTEATGQVRARSNSSRPSSVASPSAHSDAALLAEGAGIRPHGKRREAPDIPENKIFKIF